MKNNTIIDLMLKDHEKIVDNLYNVDKSGHPDIEAFLEFEWHIKKHIFIEEKAIFISYRPRDDSEKAEMFHRLSKEHSIIMDLIDSILKESFPKGNTRFNKLKKLLQAHKNFEEKKVYPLLEKNLNAKNKQQIIMKIKEII
jgi:hemerythrin superfamily protein